jgi:DNA-binding transcriptional LysR family regulator
VAQGFDAGIRLGERLQADMIAVPVSPPLRMAAAASPDYFARHSPPQDPRDLVDHTCLRYRYPSSGAIYVWEFERTGQTIEVDVTGPLTTGDQELLVRAAIEGAGIVYTVESYIADALASGQLIRILEAWCPPFPGLYLYWSSRRHVPPALRAVIDAFKRDASV